MSIKKLDYSKVCLCGCGTHPSIGKIYVCGHHTRMGIKRKKKIKKEVIKCMDCGTLTKNKKYCSAKCSKRNRAGFENLGPFFLGHHHRKETKEVLRQARLGKTYDEIYGEEGARDLKDQRSKQMKGNKYGVGYKHTEEWKNKKQQEMIGNQFGKGIISKRKGKTYEEIYGEEKAEHIRQINRDTAYKLYEEGKIGWQALPLKSYPEQYFQSFLKLMGAIENQDFFYNYQVGRYRIDFAYIDEQGKRGIEIDGKQHLIPEAIEHDKKRDLWLQEQGWTIMRIPVKNLYKLLEPLWRLP